MLVSLKEFKRHRALAGYFSDYDPAAVEMKEAKWMILDRRPQNPGETESFLEKKDNAFNEQGLFVRWPHLRDRFSTAKEWSQEIAANWNSPPVNAHKDAIKGRYDQLVSGLMDGRDNYSWDSVWGRNAQRTAALENARQRVAQQMNIDAPDSLMGTLNTTIFELRQWLATEAANQQKVEAEAQAKRLLDAQLAKEQAVLDASKVQNEIVGVQTETAVATRERAVASATAQQAVAVEKGIQADVEKYLTKLAAPKIAGVPIAAILGIAATGVVGFLVFRVVKARKAKKAAAGGGSTPKLLTAGKAVAGYRSSRRLRRRARRSGR